MTNLKIIVPIADTEFTLTLEQAEQLYKQLRPLFEKATTPPRYIYDPRIMPMPGHFRPYDVTC